MIQQETPTTIPMVSRIILFPSSADPSREDEALHGNARVKEEVVDAVVVFFQEVYCSF